MASQLLMFGAPPGDPRDSWETPDLVFMLLHVSFGFAVDLAASDDNHKLAHYYTRERSALDVDWCSLPQPIFCNPPFSELETWTRTAARTLGRCRLAMLMPANRTDRPWFHDYVLSAELVNVFFSRGRIDYVAPPGVESSSCAFGSVLVVYGYRDHEIDPVAERIAARWTRCG